MHICSPCRLIALPHNHTCIEWDLHQKRAIATTTPCAQSATKSVQLGQSAENCFHPLGLRFTEAFDFCGWSAKKCVLLRARIYSLSQICL